MSLLIDSLFLVLRRQQQTNADDEDVAAVSLKIKEAAIRDSVHAGSAALCYYPELANDLPAKTVDTIITQLVSNFYKKAQTPLRVAQALAHIARDILYLPTYVNIFHIHYAKVVDLCYILKTLTWHLKF